MTFIITTDNLTEAFFERVYDTEYAILPERLHQSSKNHSLLGRVLLAYALKREYGITEFSLRYGKNQKPYLKNDEVFFNISHSGKFVVCSVDEKEIGCDIQCHQKYNERIAERFFTKEEAELLKLSENKVEDFTRLWAMKESILKKTGEGITGGLSGFSFEDCVKESSFKKYDCFFSIYTFEDAVLSVCSESEEREVIAVQKEEIENFMDEVLCN